MGKRLNSGKALHLLGHLITLFIGIWLRGVFLTALIMMKQNILSCEWKESSNHGIITEFVK